MEIVPERKDSMGLKIVKYETNDNDVVLLEIVSDSGKPKHGVGDKVTVHGKEVVILNVHDAAPAMYAGKILEEKW